MSDLQPVTPGASPFDAIRHEDINGEYWLARELMPLLDYSQWQKFTPLISKAQKSCEGSEQQVSYHFIQTDEMVTLGSGAQRKIRDYHLTRYACYLIAMEANSGKPIVAQAKSYFAVKTREAELLELAIAAGDNALTEVANRIARRQELTEAHKQLLARARDAGVITSEQFVLFMNAGYKGLYSGETENDIHARKNLQPSQHISDYMGALETLANVLRAEVAARRMERQGVSNSTEANKTHYDAGATVRGWLTSEGIYPEQLPTPVKSYRQIVKEEARRIAREEELERGLWGSTLE